MWTARERDAPMGHGAFRIGLGGGLERTNGHAVIEAEKEPQALIKIALRFRGIGGDLAAVRAEIVKERHLGLIGVREECARYKREENGSSRES